VLHDRLVQPAEVTLDRLGRGARVPVKTLGLAVVEQLV